MKEYQKPEMEKLEFISVEEVANNDILVINVIPGGKMGGSEVSPWG